ncbi:hypothetical protein A2cp1_1912 [Anaeromyxobacter dehalogenans 2CP-1]|uniref:IPT/TIG domain-containing protein n=1 Tax=Anaeromyxobacter dehalogenans (strain ATCC BAA-258 / DSM 21875 / 2CP-1) TaxID=455488 RepID=B8J764_ANAD2|nr:IPT/TIG domain-containing protein [Anaeromyxobacter dehalogenans]ACL65254.1 hypothetical protein A2cp1_1912 [Anaeromyxobacter dehalogenans 2CP-1]
MYSRAETLAEVIVRPPGYVPASAVVRASELTPERIAEVGSALEELPRLRVSGQAGAIDVKLELAGGEQVKSGAVVLERDDRRLEVPQDPVSRRFRLDGVEPGEYVVRAASAALGRAERTISVRPDDVARVAMRLDGRPLHGTSTVRLVLAGARGDEVRVRALDKDSGRYVVDRRVPIHGGLVELEAPFGRIHWDLDDGEARSCYDTDETDVWEILPPRRVQLVARRDLDPDPPPDWTIALGDEFRSVGRVLPRIGIDSIDGLAAAEPEQLMHRMLALRGDREAPINRRLLAESVLAARVAVGAMALRGEVQTQVTLRANATFTRSLLPALPGDLVFTVDLQPGQTAELRIDGPSARIRRKVEGADTIALAVSAADVAAKRPFRVSLANTSGDSIGGIVKVSSPVAKHVPGGLALQPTVEQRISNILTALAAQNPGLGTDEPDAVLAPQNIQMWLDRARTLMTELGVCSVRDLGSFRLDPNRKLRVGAYVAPVVQPPRTIPTIPRYRFAELLQNVLYYEPNLVLHDTAVVMAGEWDIRGQDVVVGQEVRELVVIVESIRYDGATRITWETPPLPPAAAFWPSPAAPGSSGGSPGAQGGDGEDGDQAPHPTKNGGADAVVPAPIVTMYVLNATSGLPPIDLRGQDGGRGGRGQDGGRGGDGATGLRADGTFFGGCCRSVGSGGDGGLGGDAGRGGTGGKGGDGGRLTLLTTHQSIAALDAAPPSIDVNPGGGGPGGDPGNAGLGGNGGAAGTADCETWCDEHPERRGARGADGAAGIPGAFGPPGPSVVPDAIQILPITPQQWYDELNRPHILSLSVYEAEPGQTVSIAGQNFDPSIDRVFFDGADVGPVASATTAAFVVPNDSDGGFHPVVLRPAGVSDRRSNRVMLRVLPKLLALPSPPRWIEGQTVVLNGLAFAGGAQVFAEDRSVAPALSYLLPTSSVTRTAITLTIPPAPLGSLRGVRRIVVRNPDGGTSRDERAIRISDTIVVRVAAFRVVGTSPGSGTTRTAAEIADLFSEGGAFSVTAPWGQARISFRLVQGVTDVSTTDVHANTWPIDDPAADRALFAAAPGVLGALNFFFARDVEFATAYAYFGGGPLFIGDEGGPLGPVDLQQVVAHEIGHALCLRHVCDAGEGPGTFFDRACDGGDETFLMYPFWDASDGMAIHGGQVDPARIGATHVEDGKVASLPAGSLFMGNNTIPQCATADAQD